MTKQRADLTFKANLKNGRHGWIRLTPAYSVKVVHQILDDNPQVTSVLDPFSGTGTTGVVAAERGLQGSLLDINPFLVWLAKVKTDNYDYQVLQEVLDSAQQIVDSARTMPIDDTLWTPPISNIHRWWSPQRLRLLSCIYLALNRSYKSVSKVRDLLLVAFCRTVIASSNAAFNHQSMSFKDGCETMVNDTELIFSAFNDAVKHIATSICKSLPGHVDVMQADARYLNGTFLSRYDCVITSPPYVNRMSYIRELRPYMYWLGYLVTTRDAGEMDWQAIGGTWGIATSRLSDWQSQGNYQSSKLKQNVGEIAEKSEVLANYVHKYMEDIFAHFTSLHHLLQPQARLLYIVGNSKFYDTLVPVQEFYADMMKRVGFQNINIKIIRKRNSKKELFEYLVSARMPNS